MEREKINPDKNTIKWRQTKRQNINMDFKTVDSGHSGHWTAAGI